jgi:hypothetical protein
MSRDVSNYQPITLPAEAPAPAPQPQQPQALVTGGESVGGLQQHQTPTSVPDRKAAGKFYEDLTTHFKKGGKPIDAWVDKAIEFRSTKALKLLVENGVDLNRQVGPEGNTRLHNACKTGDAKAVKILLDCRADVHVDNDKFMPPSVMAFDLPAKTRFGVLREFANHRGGAVQIAAWARHLDRNDILNWTVTNGFIDKSLV